MTYLINIILLWFVIYYGNKYLDTINDPIYKKMSIMIVIIYTQYIYEKIKNFFRKKDITLNAIIDRGIHRGSLILLGYSILTDLISISDKIPNLIKILDTPRGKTSFIIFPMFLAIIFKSLLK